MNNTLLPKTSCDLSIGTQVKGMAFIVFFIQMALNLYSAHNVFSIFVIKN